MYRIELSPGEETAFRSIEELAVAIRRGVVTPKARIWHNATSKWLPIQFHPHYKAAAAMPLTKADLVAGPPVAPLSSLSLPDPASQEPRVTPFRPVGIPQPEATAPAARVTPFKPVPPPTHPEASAPASRVTPFKPASPYHQPTPQAHAGPTAGLPLIEPLGSMSAPEPIRPEPIKPEPVRPEPLRPLPATPVFSRPQPTPKAAKKRSRTRKPSKRALRVAFIGALLIGGAHILASATGALGPDSLRSHRRLIAAPPEAIKRDSPRTVAAVIPVLRNSSVPGAAAHLGAATPRKPGPTLGSATTAASLPPSLAPAPASDSAPEIQAAPAIEMAPAPAAADSLNTTVVDSSGKKVLKGILRTVSGAPGSEKKPSRR